MMFRKLKISEIDSASSIESDYYQMLSESAQTCVYTEKDKTVVLDENLATVWGVDADSKTGYGVKCKIPVQKMKTQPITYIHSL